MRSRRKQREAQKQFISRFVFTIILIGSLYGSYQFGRFKQDIVEKDQQAQIQDLNQKLVEFEKENSHQAIITQNAQNELERLKLKYQNDVPKGDAAAMFTLVQKKLNEGVSKQRLVLFINSASKKADCSALEKKRFVLPTPIYRAPNSSVSFEDGLISLTGSGEPELNSSGAPEAWYDGGKPIQLTFNILGQKNQMATGTLPLSHSIVIEDTEYKFIANQGRRSFLEVSLQKCNL